MEQAKAIQQHGYYSVGEHRGNKRIWLQGGNLTASQFEKGAAYTVLLNIDTRTIILKRCDVNTEHCRVVSGRKQPNGIISPIIDLANSDLINVTQHAQRVRVDFYIDEIHISISHTETTQVEREKRLIEHLNAGCITTGVACSGIGVSTAAIHDGLLSEG